MPNKDEVNLKVGDETIDYFKSYSINDDMFSIEDQFSMQLGHPYQYPELQVGKKCTLTINKQIEMKGRIDSVELTSNKANKTKMVSGRDITALLADSYVPSELWGTQVGIGLEEFIKTLLNSHAEFKKFKIVFGDLNTYKRITYGLENDNLLLAPLLNTLYTHISPGQTYLDVLRSYCTARGYVFYGTSSNTIVFGYPKVSGEADFYIWHGVKPAGGYKQGCAIDGSIIRDISQQYSEILVVSQRQDLSGEDLIAGRQELYIDPNISPIYKSARRIVKNLPGVAPKKLYVSEAADDIEDLDRYAELIEKQQSFDAFRLEYVVQGHQQDGVNWRSNAIAYVKDAIFNIEGNFLIYSKTFEMSKESGTITVLRLCTPGSLPNAL